MGVADGLVIEPAIGPLLMCSRRCEIIAPGDGPSAGLEVGTAHLAGVTLNDDFAGRHMMMLARGGGGVKVGKL